MTKLDPLQPIQLNPTPGGEDPIRTTWGQNVKRFMDVELAQLGDRQGDMVIMGSEMLPQKLARPDSSGILHVDNTGGRYVSLENSTTEGLLRWDGTKYEHEPVFYNKNTNSLFYWNGSRWTSIPFDGPTIDERRLEYNTVTNTPVWLTSGTPVAFSYSAGTFGEDITRTGTYMVRLGILDEARLQRRITAWGRVDMSGVTGFTPTRTTVATQTFEMLSVPIVTFGGTSPTDPFGPTLARLNLVRNVSNQRLNIHTRTGSVRDESNRATSVFTLNVGLVRSAVPSSGRYANQFALMLTFDLDTPQFNEFVEINPSITVRVSG